MVEPTSPKLSNSLPTSAYRFDIDDLAFALRCSDKEELLDLLSKDCQETEVVLPQEDQDGDNEHCPRTQSFLVKPVQTTVADPPAGSRGSSSPEEERRRRRSASSASSRSEDYCQYDPLDASLALSSSLGPGGELDLSRCVPSRERGWSAASGGGGGGWGLSRQGSAEGLGGGWAADASAPIPEHGPLEMALPAEGPAPAAAGEGAGALDRSRYWRQHPHRRQSHSFHRLNEGLLIGLSDAHELDASANSQFVLASPMLGRHDKDPSFSGIADGEEPAVRRRRKRAPTLLPSDIQALDVSVTVDPETRAPHLEVAVTTRVPLVGWGVLAVTLVAGSSTGPLEARLAYPPLLLNFWRRTCSAALFLPVAGRALADPEVRRPLLRPEARRPLALCLAGIVACNTLYYLSLQYLAVPLCSLFENTTPLLLVGLRLLSGRGISLLEGAGTVVALTGAAIVSVDALDDTDSSNSPNFALGACCAVGAAGGMALYLSQAKAVRHCLNVTVLNFVVCLLTPIATLVLELIWFRSDFGPYEELPATSIIGVLFGYILVPKLLLAQVGTSIIMDVIAQQGAIAVLRYFEALLVSIVLLLQPVVVIGLDLALGVGAPPDGLTLFGCGVVITGCACVLLSNTLGEKIEKIDASEVIKTLSGEPVFTKDRSESISMSIPGSKRSSFASSMPISRGSSFIKQGSPSNKTLMGRLLGGGNSISPSSSLTQSSFLPSSYSNGNSNHCSYDG